MVASLSKPKVSIPALSRLVNPIGPSIFLMFFSWANFIASLIKALETSSSSIKSNHPKRTFSIPNSLASL